MVGNRKVMQSCVYKGSKVRDVCTFLSLKLINLVNTQYTILLYYIDDKFKKSKKRNNPLSLLFILNCNIYFNYQKFYFLKHVKLQNVWIRIVDV